MEKTVVGQTAMSFHQGHEFLVRLEKVGLNIEVAQAVIESRKLASQVVAHIKSKKDGYDPTVSQARARDIMRENFLGIKEIAEYFGIQLTKQELTEIAEIPFSEETLQQCKDTSVLFLGVDHDRRGEPLTISRFFKMFRRMFIAGNPNTSLSWKARPRDKTDEDFIVKATLELRWYLISKQTLKGSASESFNGQNALLKEQEYRERAIVYIYMMFLLFMVTGERLFEREWVSCIDTCSLDRTVSAGYFNDQGLSIQTPSWYKGGLVPARKPDM